MKRLLSVLVLLMVVVSTAVAGETEHVKVFSASMNKNVNVTVVRPSVSRRPCPVVYLLHGAYSDATKWFELKPDLPHIADSLGFIFVCPDAQNTWYFDSPVNSDVRYETFVSSELLQYVDTHYKTFARKQGRAIMGLSMGGHGALFIAFRHKALYGACGSMSGGVDFRPFPQNWFIKDQLGEMAANKKVWDEHVVVNNISRISNHDLAITIDCGESDFFLEVNKTLHQRLLALDIDHDFTTRPGGHNNEYWANSFDYQMLFFKKYFTLNLH